MTPRALKALPPSFAEPPDIEEADIYAVKAVWAGVANQGQQQRAMKWIIYKAARLSNDPFRTDARLTDHLVGRQSVGRMVIDLVNTILPQSEN